MYIRCGYACINQTIGRSFRSFRKQTLLDKDWSKVDSILSYNFELLRAIIKWNINNNFYLFRMSSNIIPFLSDNVMQDYIKTTDLFNRLNIQCIMDDINKIVKEHNFRLTLHLIEYTHLNSNDELVMYQGYVELIEQYKLLTRLGGTTIVFHGGGLYGSNPYTMLDRLHERLYNIRNLVDLNMLAIENDDRTYTASQVKQFAKSLGIGWCFDFHHYRCNPSKNVMDDLIDYNPCKYHLSTGVKDIYDRKHSYYISYVDLLKMLNLLIKCDIRSCDIVFEAKGKELSVLEIMKPLSDGYWTLK